MVKRSYLVIVLMLTLAVSACSVSLKERAVQVVQTASVSADAARSAEMSLFEARVLSELTPEAHRAFHAAYVKYADAEYQMAGLLQAWRAGEPPPAGLTAQVRVASEAIAEMQKVLPSRAASALSPAAAAAEAVLNLLTLLEKGN